ncbi:MAG TPA: NUDIX domain-containing protein [Candidatus Nesterenkonia stercoripullorum]|uniref:8-oxo-dGTP diphosphatase n=1 Tax=Candidatus Nesterenkonia stercoripullorum TaxID=2838701 RepID=A0A9D2A878_9MICC|nr:NUDIX domain-containing protein [Candidatus Nesterenkonia stercoripullorum]
MSAAAADTVIVTAAVTRAAPSGEQLLIARRTAPEAIAGLWEFPGGKWEPGETALDGVTRELREELGVEVEIVGEVQAPGHPAFEPGAGWRLNEKAVMRLFQAVLPAGSTAAPAPLQDHDRLDWVALDHTVLDYPWIPADLPIVRHMLNAHGGVAPDC